MAIKKRKRVSFGANFVDNKNIEFTLWAPDAKEVEVCTYTPERKNIALKRNSDGLFKARVQGLKNKSLYTFNIDNKLEVPDPASRYQPEDAHGKSQIIDPNNFNWGNDSKWRGLPWQNAIIYELHTGTFTPQGNYFGIKEKLNYLAELGINTIELMPIADFSGKRNWGYDGVLWYAPDSSYGTPDELKELIKAAHKRGIMVILDVVYNHFGPDANYLYVYAKSKFFDKKTKSPWGDAINYKNRFVRDFIVNNALYWLKEYHFDGFRFDAIQEIKDQLFPDILEELALEVRSDRELGKRHIHLLVENDNNETKYIDPAQNGDFDAQLNDDFHHCAHILSTGEEDGYYGDYLETITKKTTAQHLVKTLSEGFDYQGEFSSYRRKNRGKVSQHLAPYKFVNFIQNHDQVGNRALGERISSLASKKMIKALAVLYILTPSIPLIFMGEEWGSKTPFYFFCDFNKELNEAVKTGRRNEFAKFKQFSQTKEREIIPDPADKKTFINSKLDWANMQKKEYKEIFNLYKNLISIRKKVFSNSMEKIKFKQIEFVNEKSFGLTWDLNGSNLTVLANFDNIPITSIFSIKKKDILISSESYSTDSNDIKSETVIWLLK